MSQITQPPQHAAGFSVPDCRDQRFALELEPAAEHVVDSGGVPGKLARRRAAALRVLRAAALVAVDPWVPLTMRVDREYRQ